MQFWAFLPQLKQGDSGRGEVETSTPAGVISGSEDSVSLGTGPVPGSLMVAPMVG